MKRGLLLGLVLMGAGGCITTQKSGEVAAMTPEVAAPEVTSPVTFKLDGSNKFRYQSNYTSFSCGAHSFNLDFRSKGRRAARETMGKVFDTSGSNTPEANVQLEILQTVPSINCGPSLLGVHCRGSIAIRSKLQIDDGNGRSSQKEISVLSDDDGGSHSLFCAALGDETESNFSSAFRKLMEDVVKETKGFIADGDA